MLLGNRPRPPTRRTTSSTEFLAGVLLDIELPQLPDPEGSIGGEAIDPHLGVAQGSIAGVGVDWRAARFLGFMLSPRGGMQRELFVSPETVGFLRACGLCNRRLGPGRDAFMYRNFSFYFLQAVDVVFSEGIISKPLDACYQMSKQALREANHRLELVTEEHNDVKKAICQAISERELSQKKLAEEENLKVMATRETEEILTSALFSAD